MGKTKILEIPDLRKAIHTNVWYQPKYSDEYKLYYLKKYSVDIIDGKDFYTAILLDKNNNSIIEVDIRKVLINCE